MPNHCLCDQLYIRISVLVHSRAASSTSKRTSFKSKRHVSFVLCISLFYRSNVNAIGGTSWPLVSPADGSKRTKRVQGWLCKFDNIPQ